MVLEGLGGNDGGRKVDLGGVHARPSLPGGAQGADGNRRLPILPRGFLLQTSQRAKRAGAFRHGFLEAGASNPEGKRGPRPGFGIIMSWMVRRPIKPLRGRIKVPVMFRASPFGASRYVGQPRHQSRKRPSSNGFQALKMASVL
jgi:hypothetical protein